LSGRRFEEARPVLPTAAEVLRLPVLAEGHPEVLAGADELDRRVRWVHIAPVSGVGRLLAGEEMLLSTGVGWPTDERQLFGYIAELNDARISALVLELGQRYTEAPPAVVRACAELGLPFVVLHREVRFVAVTEVVHSLIISSQMAELRERNEIHELFTDLTRRGASPDFVVSQAARLLKAPVVLEDLNHHVVTWEALTRESGALLADWEKRSRSAAQQATPAASAGTRWWHEENWLITRVEARGQHWGNLVTILGTAQPATDRTTARTADRATPDRHTTADTVLEQAAATISLGRIAERGADDWMRLAHTRMVTTVVEGRYASTDALRAILEARGFRVHERLLAGLAVQVAGRPVGDVVEHLVVEQLRDSARSSGYDLIGAAVRERPYPTVLSILSLPRLDDPDAAIDRLCAAVAGAVAPSQPVFASGAVVAGLADLPRSLADAADVIATIPRETPRDQSGGSLVHRPPAAALAVLIGNRSLDPSVQRFVEATLGRILKYDADHHGDLLGVLRAYVAHPTNRTNAAKACHLSRSVFYQRLELIEQLLGIDLADGRSIATLHAALLAHART
jgi:purine catabolism regulator